MSGQRTIFLDVDGVLNSVRNKFHGIDPANVVQRIRLRRTRTGACIVVSSTWRNAGLAAMRETLASAGVVGRVVGITPFLPRVRQGDYDVSADRGDEIQAWLSVARPFPDRFVILDDDADFGDLLPLLVRTDNAVGLTAQDVDRAAALLLATEA